MAHLPKIYLELRKKWTAPIVLLFALTSDRWIEKH